MRARILLVATALAAVVPALPSSAATCPLLVDPRGDATPVASGNPTPADDRVDAAATDILSADARAGGGWLETTLRLAELPPEAAVPRGYGHAWDIRLRA